MLLLGLDLGSSMRCEGLEVDLGGSCAKDTDGAVALSGESVRSMYVGMMRWWSVVSVGRLLTDGMLRDGRRTDIAAGVLRVP